MNKCASCKKEIEAPAGNICEKCVKQNACPHVHVHLSETWTGQGRVVRFQCNDCDAVIRPMWEIARETH